MCDFMQAFAQSRRTLVLLDEEDNHHDKQGGDNADHYLIIWHGFPLYSLFLRERS